MKTAIRYWSRTGHAKKLAEGIASVLGIPAEEVTKPLEEDTDILFLCNSVYWNGVDSKVKSFLKNLGHKIGSLVNVSTSAIKESSYSHVKALAEKEGIPVSAQEFHCRGEFMGTHKGHPDEQDVAAVEAFARRVAGEQA